jgi:hypothetical protein
VRRSFAIMNGPSRFLSHPEPLLRSWQRIELLFVPPEVGWWISLGVGMPQAHQPQSSPPMRHAEQGEAREHGKSKAIACTRTRLDQLDSIRGIRPGQDSHLLPTCDHNATGLPSSATTQPLRELGWASTGFLSPLHA